MSGSEWVGLGERQVMEATRDRVQSTTFWCVCALGSLMAGLAWWQLMNVEVARAGQYYFVGIFFFSAALVIASTNRWRMVYAHFGVQLIFTLGLLHVPWELNGWPVLSSRILGGLAALSGSLLVFHWLAWCLMAAVRLLRKKGKRGYPLDYVVASWVIVVFTQGWLSWDRVMNPVEFIID